MKLTPPELAYVRSQGLHVTEKCGGCGKLLNQTVQYTIYGKPEVYCSAVCRDSVFFGDRREAKKAATPGKCAYCGGTLRGKKRGAIFGDDVCRKALSRTNKPPTTGKTQKSRTLTQSNQPVEDAKAVEQGNRISVAPQRIKSTLGIVSTNIVSAVEMERRILGGHGI
jgi:hypothetical protein